MSKHPKADLYLAERKKGMTFREIAEKYDVSYQSVHATCVRVDGTYSTKTIQKSGCIYPNLRRWLNADVARRDAFFHAMKGCSIREFLKGERQPKKDAIDRMLKFTCMTYEEMFAEEEDYG